MTNNLVVILYVLMFIGSGIGIGFFLKSLKVEIKVLQLQIEDLKNRIMRIENKIMRT